MPHGRTVADQQGDCECRRFYGRSEVSVFFFLFRVLLLLLTLRGRLVEVQSLIFCYFVIPMTDMRTFHQALDNITYLRLRRLRICHVDMLGSRWCSESGPLSQSTRRSMCDPIASTPTQTSSPRCLLRRTFCKRKPSLRSPTTPMKWPRSSFCSFLAWH